MFFLFLTQLICNCFYCLLNQNVLKKETQQVTEDFSSGCTSSTRSSSISLKTVPLIWLGFRAVQLNTGRRNFVLIGFLILIAVGGILNTQIMLNKAVNC